MNTQKNQPLLSWFSVKGRARRKEVWIKWIINYVARKNKFVFCDMI